MLTVSTSGSGARSASFREKLGDSIERQVHADRRHLPPEPAQERVIAAAAAELQTRAFGVNLENEPVVVVEVPHLAQIQSDLPAETECRELRNDRLEPREPLTGARSATGFFEHLDAAGERGQIEGGGSDDPPESVAIVAAQALEGRRPLLWILDARKELEGEADMAEREDGIVDSELRERFPRGQKHLEIRLDATRSEMLETDLEELLPPARARRLVAENFSAIEETQRELPSRESRDDDLRRERGEIGAKRHDFAVPCR